MPHECTNCGRVFADGSKEMLSGCPNCGGNKFQFQPSSATDSGPDRETHDRSRETEATGTGSPSRDSGGPDTHADSGGPDTDTHADSGGPDTDTHADSGGPDTDTHRPDTPDRNTTGRDSESPSAGSNAWSGTADRALDDRSGETRDPSREWVNERRDDAVDRSASDTDLESPSPTTESDSASTTEPDPASTTDPDPSSTTDPDPAVSPDSAPDVGSAPDPGSASDPDLPEDTAQASARSDVVSPDELPAAGPDRSDTPEGNASPSGADSADRDGPPTDAEGRVIEPSTDERPDLEDLREELNEQFESIRIVAPGEYELNLMELYDRTEYIISLQEDGRYIIEVPDTWDTTPDTGEDA